MVKSCPTLIRQLRPYPRAEERRERANHSKTMERWATVCRSKRTSSRAHLVPLGQSLASYTEGHSDWPHETEKRLHIPMNERYWTLVPHVNKKVSHEEKYTFKEMMALLRSESDPREEGGVCYWQDIARMPNSLPSLDHKKRQQSGLTN